MITPAGPLSVPIALLRAAIAASTTFQAAVGAADATAALPRVMDEMPEGSWEDLKKPFAVVRDGEQLEAVRVAAGAQDYLRWSGTVEVTFVADDGGQAPAGGEADAKTAFRNFAGGVMHDVAQNAGVDAGLAIERIAMTIPPSRSHPADAVDGQKYWVCKFAVSWPTA